MLLPTIVQYFDGVPITDTDNQPVKLYRRSNEGQYAQGKEQGKIANTRRNAEFDGFASLHTGDYTATGQ